MHAIDYVIIIALALAVIWPSGIFPATAPPVAGITALMSIVTVAAKTARKSISISCQTLEVMLK